MRYDRYKAHRFSHRSPLVRNRGDTHAGGHSPFATVGDGVEVQEATGLHHLTVVFGHTLVWRLLTIAFIIATIRGRWSKPSQVFAVAAGIGYGLFLFAVFLWP